MSLRPFRDIHRKITKVINVGNVKIGGDNPISVQSMTNTLTTDIQATIKQINVDMVVQNISSNSKETDLTFTIKSEDLKKTEKIIKQNKKISFRKFTYDSNVSKVSIVGVGMITTPGITYRMFQALASKKINIDMVVQNISLNGKETDLTFTIKSEDVKKNRKNNQTK